MENLKLKPLHRFVPFRALFPAFFYLLISLDQQGLITSLFESGPNLGRNLE